MDKITIGNRIKYERSRLGLTLEEFGQQIGVSKQCLSGWEHGRNMPDVISLHKMAEICGIEIKDFLYAPDELSIRASAPNTHFEQFTAKERQFIHKIRTLSPERRKAVEILFGIRDKK